MQGGETMTIYLLMWYVEYEGATVVGAFTTKEKAQAAADAANAKEKAEYEASPEFPVSDQEWYVHPQEVTE